MKRTHHITMTGMFAMYANMTYSFHFPYVPISLILISAFLILVRGYFDLDLYKPFEKLKEKCKTWYKQFLEKKIQRQKSHEKRKHTEELKNKIDAKSEFKVNRNQNYSDELKTTNQKIDKG